MQIYRTEGNESIYDIAREHGVSPVKIAEENELEVRSKLPKGREILIRTPTRTYNAKSTDTLDRIANRFKTSKECLMRQNPELGGKEKLYSGQLLTISESTPSYGMISTNGYLYAGTSKNRLAAIIPYLSYVTVCSAVYKDGHVHNIFPNDEAVGYIKSYGRAPILRVYMSELPKYEDEANFASSIAILAASSGFAGITLSSLNTMSDDKKRLCELVFAVRKILMENDLLLFTEGDLDIDCSYMDYSDAGVLTYDKLHRQDIPEFDEGEKAGLEKFAYSLESSRAFLEMSSFAWCSGRFIEKGEAARIADKKHAEISYDEKSKLLKALFGRHKKRELVSESLENTKSKLVLVSELGFMGISFDIGRVYTPDLMMMVSMFDVICHPVMSPKYDTQEI